MYREIIVITTPPTVQPFKQVTCLMSPKELEEAKLERPDLIFTKGKDLPVLSELPPVENQEEGISLYGMTAPPEAYE